VITIIQRDQFSWMMRICGLHLRLLVLLASSLLLIFSRDQSQSISTCDRDIDVSMNLVNQFVRIDRIPLDPMKVIQVLENVILSTGCDPNFFSVAQMKMATLLLKRKDISDDRLLHMIEIANREELQSKVEAQPHLAWKFYSEALLKWPADSRLRFELGKSLAIMERYDDAISNLKLAAQDSIMFQAATFAMASILRGRSSEDAIACYTALVGAEPSSEVYWFMFSDALQMASSRDTSSRHAERLDCCLESIIAALNRTLPFAKQDHECKDSRAAALPDEIYCISASKYIPRITSTS
jgi:hypothetical protein